MDRDTDAVWRAQLAEMSWETVVRFVEEQGYTVEPRPWPIDLIRERASMFRWLLERDRLPPGYPPDEGALPFEVEG
jgi:hypothetical protein